MIELTSNFYLIKDRGMHLKMTKGVVLQVAYIKSLGLRKDTGNSEVRLQKAPLTKIHCQKKMFPKK